MANLVIIR